MKAILLRNDFDHALKIDEEDTLVMVNHIRGALESSGISTVDFPVNFENLRSLRRLNADLFFNIVEDEEWVLSVRVAKTLDLLGKPVVGSSYDSLRASVSKVAAKRRLIAHDLPTPRFQFFESEDARLDAKMKYPLIVKPESEHAGIGIAQASVVKDTLELKSRLEFVLSSYPGRAVVEEYIEGREIHATVVGNGKRLDVWPLSEYKFESAGWGIYSYDAKWDESSSEYKGVKLESPALLDLGTRLKIEKLAKEAFIAFGCRDYVRFDMRVRGKDVYILDINVNPSLTQEEFDATWSSAQALGLDYGKMIETLVSVATRRFREEASISTSLFLAP